MYSLVSYIRIPHNYFYFLILCTDVYDIELADSSSTCFQMQISTGRHHTILVNGSSVYSCGSSLCGVLGHGRDTTQCGTFRRISFPSLSHVIHVSASHNHAAFVMQAGEVGRILDKKHFLMLASSSEYFLLIFLYRFSHVEITRRFVAAMER